MLLPFLRRLRLLLLLAAIAPLLVPGSIKAQTAVVRLGVVSSLSGPAAAYGTMFVDSVRLAVEEANAANKDLRIDLDVIDDGSSTDKAREAAVRLGASDVLAVVGPLLSTSSIAAGPAFAEAGLASITATAESDLITRNATTYRADFKNSDVGEALADYLRYALDGNRAAVIFVDNGYGQTLAAGFRRGAERLAMPTTYHGFKNAAERDAAVEHVLADPDKPTVILAMLLEDAVPVVTALRRRGFKGKMLGGTGIAGEPFSAAFAQLPEEKQTPGFFTQSVYAAAPIIFDSANAATLTFEQRFRDRFGAAAGPVDWQAAQGYDAGRLAIAAIGAARALPESASLTMRREAVRGYLNALNSPAKAMTGLAGPLWFTADRGRPLPIRVGRFTNGLFESAPLQLVPVARPSADEIASGELVDIGANRYARRQQVVYTGMYLNEITQVNVAQSSFTADIYVWIRYARDFATADANPTQIAFPDLIRGTFDASQPAARRDSSDGTSYRLWRLHGDFKNDFDLHRYPADRQTLDVRFFNARAASDHLVYVRDRSFYDSPAAVAERQSGTFGQSTAQAAFRNLTQWEPVKVSATRDILVSGSALGDLALVGQERVRELSGFNLQVEVRRLISSTLIKTLLPVGLMTLILFATLYLPSTLSAAKLSLSITAALAGAVLLAAINAQLGGVGYVIAIEYGFYIFFILCLLSIIVILLSERRKVHGHSIAMVETVGRALFAVIFFATIAAAWYLIGKWH